MASPSSNLLHPPSIPSPSPRSPDAAPSRSHTRARAGLVLRGALLFLVALALALADSVYRPVSVRFVPTVTAPLVAASSAPDSAAPPASANPSPPDAPPDPSTPPATDPLPADPLKSRFASIMIDSALAVDLYTNGTADGSPVDFIDARSPEHFAQGHVPGAYNLPPEAFQAAKPALMDVLSRDVPLIIYCDGGDCEASELVAVRLQEYRFEKLYILRDGFPGWQTAGGPVKVGP